MNLKSINLGVIIPAAGQASRMGSPKQLLPWKDSTLIGHTCQLALSLDPKNVLVVTGAYRESIEKHLENLAVDCLYNPDWEQGLGSSIAVGAKKILEQNLKLDGVLVVLPDQPLIPQSYLEAMIETFKKANNQIIATSYGIDSWGVPALFEVSYLSELSRLDQDFGAKHLMKRHLKMISALNVDVDLSDVDTMQDYKALLQASRQ